jgi:hypothetical protein
MATSSTEDYYSKPIPVIEIDRIPNGFQQITTLSSATSLTVPANSRAAIVQCTAQNVRWRDDGTNPTTTIGMQLKAGSEYTFLYIGGLSAIKFIEETASAVLNISYYK